ncbi:formyl transferase, partial [Campylobacter coli]|nr:formyl transferase [Campylobacter coli]EHC1478582.1 formyl transferase [Campylobacter coli]EJW5378748.1 formyl transferase [Campylobacter coli]
MTYSYIYIIGTGKVAKECQKIANDFFRQEVNFVKNIENLDDFFKNLKNC